MAVKMGSTFYGIILEEFGKKLFWGIVANNNEARSANSCDVMVINLQRASQLQFWRIQQKRQRNAFSLLLAFNHSAFCRQRLWQIHTVIKHRKNCECCPVSLIWSRLSKIVKNVKSCQICQKMSKLFNNKNLNC